jgi:two-component system KDP operon response regulator KdpE
MSRILVVDDEPQMLKALQINLKARHFTVATAPDGRLALQEATRNPPDAVILDLGLPELDGLDVIRELRTWSEAPVIVLSGRSSSHEKVAALDAGADDYVTKPFSMSELMARLRAALRRPSTEELTSPGVTIGPYTLDLLRCQVVPTGGEGPIVRLTPTEWRILAVLVQHPGRLVSGRHILQRVWGPGHEDRTNYLRVYFSGLRRKLEPDPGHPKHLLTEPGMGYRFEP